MPTTFPMLPGQAAAPEGPCDLTAMYVIHHAFRRDLGRFTRAVSATPHDDLATWAALLERWDRFAHLLHDHHRKEDEVLWPLLEARVDSAGDTAAHTVLDEMEAEHALIDPLLSEARDLLAAAADGRAEKARLAAVLTRTTSVLDGHLGHEEADAVAIMQRYITGPEWKRLENKDLRGKQTVREVLYFLPWAAEGLEPPVLALLVSEAGAPFRLALKLGRRRFATLEERAFMHVDL